MPAIGAETTALTVFAGDPIWKESSSDVAGTAEVLAPGVQRCPLLSVSATDYAAAQAIVFLPIVLKAAATGVANAAMSLRLDVALLQTSTAGTAGAGNALQRMTQFIIVGSGDAAASTLLQRIALYALFGDGCAESLSRGNVAAAIAVDATGEAAALFLKIAFIADSLAMASLQRLAQYAIDANIQSEATAGARRLAQYQGVANGAAHGIVKTALLACLNGQAKAAADGYSPLAIKSTAQVFAEGPATSVVGLQNRLAFHATALGRCQAQAKVLPYVLGGSGLPVRFLQPSQQSWEISFEE